MNLVYVSSFVSLVCSLLWSPPTCLLLIFVSPPSSPPYVCFPSVSSIVLWISKKIKRSKIIYIDMIKELCFSSSEIYTTCIFLFTQKKMDCQELGPSFCTNIYAFKQFTLRVLLQAYISLLAIKAMFGVKMSSLYFA